MGWRKDRDRDRGWMGVGMVGDWRMDRVVIRVGMEGEWEFGLSMDSESLGAGRVEVRIEEGHGVDIDVGCMSGWSQDMKWDGVRMRRDRGVMGDGMEVGKETGRCIVLYSPLTETGRHLA